MAQFSEWGKREPADKDATDVERCKSRRMNPHVLAWYRRSYEKSSIKALWCPVTPVQVLDAPATNVVAGTPIASECIDKMGCCCKSCTNASSTHTHHIWFVVVAILIHALSSLLAIPFHLPSVHAITPPRVCPSLPDIWQQFRCIYYRMKRSTSTVLSRVGILIVQELDGVVVACSHERSEEGTNPVDPVVALERGCRDARTE